MSHDVWRTQGRWSMPFLLFVVCVMCVGLWGGLFSVSALCAVPQIGFRGEQEKLHEKKGERGRDALPRGVWLRRARLYKSGGRFMLRTGEGVWERYLPTRLKHSRAERWVAQQPVPRQKPTLRSKKAPKARGNLLDFFYKQLRGKPKPRPRAKPGSLLITGIVFRGLKRVPASKLRGLIFSQTGDSFSNKTLRRDLRRLERTGLFRRVRARVQRDGSLVKIIFELVEQSNWIRGVYFRGNRVLSARALKRRLRLRPGMPLNRQQLAKDAQGIVRLYHQLGYFRARVTVQGRWMGKEELWLVFVIDEGKSAQIRRVTILGNRRISERTLLGLLDSQVSGANRFLTGRGIYHPSFVARDLYFMRNYYFNHGHLQAKVRGPRIVVSRDRRWVELTYTVREGPVFRYGAIQLEGELLNKRKTLRSLIGAKTGGLFNRSALFRKTVDPLLNFYRDRGYAFAKAQLIPLLEPGKNLMNLRIRLTKGPLIRIEAIEILGNQHTLDFVIRRRVRVRVGQLYHHTKIRRSQRLIYALGFFTPTDATYGVKASLQRGSKPNHVKVRFFVREKSTWIYNFGFNYLPDFGWMFSGQLGKRNFLGRGQTLLGSGLISTSLRQWNARLFFLEPHLGGSLWSLATSVAASYYTSLALGYIRQITGGNMVVSRPLGLPWLRASLTYRLEQVSVTSGTAESLGGRLRGYFTSRRTSGLRLGLQFDTRDRRIGATRGMWHFASYEHVAPYLGADYTMHRFSYGSRFYWTLPRSLVFRAALTMGYVLSPDASGVPVFQRFNLGGAYTIRGYLLDSISPLIRVPSSLDPGFARAALPLGGNKRILINAELEIPIVQSVGLKGVLFFDAGNAYDNDEWLFEDRRNNVPFGLFLSTGVGIRFQLPGLGVVRFEAGIPLTPRPGDPSWTLRFLVGESIF